MTQENKDTPEFRRKLVEQLIGIEDPMAVIKRHDLDPEVVLGWIREHSERIGSDFVDLGRPELISHSLEAHILQHPEGEQCLEMLYQLHDLWTSYEWQQSDTKAEDGRKGAETNTRRRQEALEWYLAEGEKIQKSGQACSSYTKLAVKLQTNAQNNSEAAAHYKSDATIADDLRKAAKEWYCAHGEALVRENPDIEVDRLVDGLHELAEEKSPVFALSRKCDIRIYLANPLELWRVKVALGIKVKPKAS